MPRDAFAPHTTPTPTRNQAASEILVGLRRDKMLRTRFPTHATKLGELLIELDTQGNCTCEWEAFRRQGLDILANPAV